ncbi:MAG TPA: hypothetical protein VK826_11135 [Bacteroidia bacterium]|nr:hypothetical protein [Bacteroidia bacterium]
MKHYFYLLLLPAALLFSCGDDKPKENPDTTAVVERDYFKEGVQTLRRNGFLKKYSEKQLDSLTEVFREDSLNGMKNLMVAAGDMLDIDIALNGRAPHDVYKALSDTIGAKYPDLKSNQVRHEYLPETPSDKDTGWVVFEQRFGNSWYSRKLYYFEDWPVDNFVYRMYNTMLADSNKNTRLYLVEFFTATRDSGAYDDFMGNLDITRMGLLRLTQQQADSIMHIPELAIEPEQEFNVYTTAKVDAELAKFEATGLVDPKDKWYQEAKTEIRQNSIYKQEDILDFVDTFFCTLMFDTLNDYNPYEELLMYMSRVSRGNFEPDGVSDQPIGQSNVRGVRFSLNGQAYERDLATQNGLRSPVIMDMVNEALAEQNAGGAYYSVLTRSDVVLAVYIDDSKIDQVIKSGFFRSVEKGASSELQIIYGQVPSAF